MAARWFRLPAVGDGSRGNPYRPDLQGYEVEGWAGAAAHPDGRPRWVVRVYADSGTLDSLAESPGVVDLDGLPVAALNAMLGQDRTKDGWRRGFGVGVEG